MCPECGNRHFIARTSVLNHPRTHEKLRVALSEIHGNPINIVEWIDEVLWEFTQDGILVDKRDDLRIDVDTVYNALGDEAGLKWLARFLKQPRQRRVSERGLFRLKLLYAATAVGGLIEHDHPEAHH